MNNYVKNQEYKSEVVFWSIALPGFGQLLNRKYVKAFILIFLELIINVKGKINLVIVHSFLGEMHEAIDKADYLWLMFYPCIYVFAIWDAYRDAGGEKYPFIYLPFVFAAYFGTIGVIYSSKFKIFGYLIGPIFLPIITMILGFVIGFFIRRVIYSTIRKKGKT
ncbi:hypothetical protein SPD48_04240 [Pseudogracilibacillus sp. SE30717A]|uniref:hypothetical protein n=1 Tax=Pseudogracilibacillus sp. SE30717A TaxID=3098293 RepID=UPI00300DE5D3